MSKNLDKISNTSFILNIDVKEVEHTIVLGYVGEGMSGRRNGILYNINEIRKFERIEKLSKKD